MDLFGHLLVVGLEEFNGLLEGLEHLIRAGLALPDGEQVAHDGHQTLVVALLHLPLQPSVCHFDELSQLLQAVDTQGMQRWL